MGSSAPSFEDRTVYPVEERVGEDIVQRWIVEILRPLVERWLAERGEPCFVGADQFIYFEQYNPGKRTAPDVYVLPGVAPDEPVRSWKVWETGIVPSFALEIASLDWEKDYIDAPQNHGQLGTKELVIFDPRFAERREGVRWQRYERTSNGRFVMVQRTDDDRIESKALGCYLRAVGYQRDLRLRLALLPEGETLFPTQAEAERLAKEQERFAKEQERREKEQERREKEQERREKDAALRRVAELEALLKSRQ